MGTITRLIPVAFVVAMAAIGCESNTLVGGDDPSNIDDHYASKKGVKTNVCHSNAEGAVHLLSISENAVSAHLAHGDALPGESVAGVFGKKYADDCSIVDASPDFLPFYIRNSNGTITPPWDANLSILENTEGDGFAAMTPNGGQKVGYGTTFFDGLPINGIETADWDKIGGAANKYAYLNIWVTDGAGNYAIIASEDDYRGENFASRAAWKVFEFGPTTNLDWLFESGTGGRTSGSGYLLHNGVNTTLAELGDDIIIGDPSVVFGTPGSYPSNVGTGAPRSGAGFQRWQSLREISWHPRHAC